MAWKKGTKIATFQGQVKVRRELQAIASKMTVQHWLSQEYVKARIENIILDYWGAMGPDCMFGRLATA